MSGVPRSQALVQFYSAAAGQTAQFTCPANHVTLVKSFYAYNPETQAAQAALTVTTPRFPAWLYVANLDMQGTNGLSWEGWVVLNPGDSVFVTTNGPNIRGWVSGAVLAGAPQFTPAFVDLPGGEPNG